MELKKHTLLLRAGDFDTIGQYFPDVKPSRVIRNVISDFVDRNLRNNVTDAELDKLSSDIGLDQPEEVL